MAAGWFINIWSAAGHGADTSLGAFLNIGAAFILAIFPMIFGAAFSNRSQRAGDIAFSVVMILEGVGMAALGMIS
jgi:hypothetical protein